MNLLSRSLILSVLVQTVACSSIPKLKVDPCTVWPSSDNPLSCHAVPLHQPGKASYDREVEPLDVCFTMQEYSALQKHVRNLERTRIQNSCQVDP
jgi:hypothetical protein